MSVIQPAAAGAGVDSAQASRNTKNRRIVEGALLADIAVVLLLGRVYIPIPVVRTVWRLLAGAPFVLLAERQGIRVTVMSGLVAYALMTALVGPTLALTVLDTAFAAIIIALAVRWRWPRVMVAVVGGLIYAVCDVIVPTILLAMLFRLPISTLVQGVRTAMRGAVRLATEILDALNKITGRLLGHSAPRLPAASLRALGYDFTAFVIGHWVLFAFIAAVAMGMANIFGYHAAADVVLERLPPSTRTRQDVR
jgi:hypothetical protein